MINKFYVYFLISNDIPYYVGMSKTPESRYIHTSKQRDLYVIECFNSMDDAIVSEIFWMEQLRQWGFKLKNKRDYPHNKIVKKKKVRRKMTFFKVGDTVFDQDWINHQIKINNYWQYIQFGGRQYGLSKMIDITGYSEQIRTFNEPTKLIKTYVPESKYIEINSKIKEILCEYEIIPKSFILKHRAIHMGIIRNEGIEQDRIIRAKYKERNAKLLGLLKHIRNKSS